jgi:4-amino-4-deoxy-L-arabinose transferase-like glycosyltransferase
MGTAAMFCIASRAATPDSSLIFSSVMAIMIYVAGTFRRKTEAEERAAAPPQLRVPRRYFPSWPVAALMYAWMGLGMLAKGPVGLILPTAVIGMFMLIMRLPDRAKSNAGDEGSANWNFLHWSLLVAILVGSVALDATIGPLQTFAIFVVGLVSYGLWRPASLAGNLIRPFEPRHFLATCWQMRPLTALAVALAIATPWYVWVGLRTDGVWLEEFFLKHNVGRATQTFEGHRGVYLFYPVSLFGGFFPWSILLIPAVVGVVTRIRQRDAWQIGYLLAACWIGVYMAVFSLAKTKLPSYITPAYPAVAMMLGAFLFRWSRGEATSRIWPRLSFSALAIIGIGIAIGLPVAAHVFTPGDEWLGVLGLLPMIAAATCYFLHTRKLPHLAAGTMAAFAAIFMTTAMGFVAAQASRHQRIDLLLQKTYESTASPKLATHGAHEPSWVFYWGHTLPIIGHGESTEDIATYFRDPDAFLLTTERALPGIQPLLPDDVQPLARERFFMRKYDLILLGRTPAAVKLARGANDAVTR